MRRGGRATVQWFVLLRDGSRLGRAEKETCRNPKLLRRETGLTTHKNRTSLNSDSAEDDEHERARRSHQQSRLIRSPLPAFPNQIRGRGSAGGAKLVPHWRVALGADRHSAGSRTETLNSLRARLGSLTDSGHLSGNAPRRCSKSVGYGNTINRLSHLATRAYGRRVHLQSRPLLLPGRSVLAEGLRCRPATNESGTTYRGADTGSGPPGRDELAAALQTVLATRSRLWIRSRCTSCPSQPLGAPPLTASKARTTGGPRPFSPSGWVSITNRILSRVARASASFEGSPTLRGASHDPHETLEAFTIRPFWNLDTVTSNKRSCRIGSNKLVCQPTPPPIWRAT